jgi:hypothetical protein
MEPEHPAVHHDGRSARLPGGFCCAASFDLALISEFSQLRPQQPTDDLTAGAAAPRQLGMRLPQQKWRRTRSHHAPTPYRNRTRQVPKAQAVPAEPGLSKALSFLQVPESIIGLTEDRPRAVVLLQSKRGHPDLNALCLYVVACGYVPTESRRGQAQRGASKQCVY